MKIDSREFRLGKWYIPKNAEACKPKELNTYHALGYFDIIDVKHIEQKEERHLLAQAYTQSYRHNNKSLGDFFVQEIKAFTNISDNPTIGFMQSTIEEFWEKDSLVLCFSMLQLYLEKDIDQILEKIRVVFSGVNYLYYFTFDYSGIILLAKDVSIESYTDLLFEINYGNSDNNKLVKDTFSMYGLRKDQLNKIFLKFQKDWKKDEIQSFCSDSKNYEISVNINVRDYTVYMDFRKELKTQEQQLGYCSREFKLSGRHDISIVNYNGDITWLLYIQFLLDKYTNKKIGSFYAYESFIKVKNQPKNYIEEECLQSSNSELSERLFELCEKFKTKAEKNKYLPYCTPIYEVYNSVNSILKNGFAEDFVLCMYQSFYEFLRYMLKKLEEEENPKARKEGIQYREEFDQCFCAYFESLNSLVNSAMHTDRQFTQATAFNAIYYDIPPKLMAFYVAIIDCIKKIMQTEANNTFTFLMSPSFSDEIRVKRISYKEKDISEDISVDRILRVSVSERSLYNPEAVIRRMAHEVAHHVGGVLRNRSLRKIKIIDTFIHIILQQILHSDFACDDAYWQLQKSIVDDLLKNYFFDAEKLNRSQDLEYLHNELLKFFIKSEKIQSKLRKYIYYEIDITLKEGRGINHTENSGKEEKKGYFSELINREINFRGEPVIRKLESNDIVLSKLQKEILTSLIMEDIKKELLRLMGKSEEHSVVYSLGDTILKEYKFLRKYAKALISLYSETYADLQMILLLDISYEDYLKGFIEDENMDIEQVVTGNEDISRITIISKLMYEEKKWKLECKQDKLQNLNLIIQNHLKKLNTEQDNPYQKQNMNLMIYLKTCMKESKKYYKNKYKDIKHLQEISKVINNYQDAKEVYTIICEVILQYRDSLVKLP